MASGIGLRRISRWIALAALVCASGAVPVAREYRTVEVESLRLTIDSDWVPRATPGYLPVRFEVTNLGDARVIELIGYGTRYFRSSSGSAPYGRSTGTGSMTVSQTLRLARGDRVRFTMAVPIFGDSENIRFELHEGNRTLERFNYAGFQSRSPAADASVLLVADPASPFGSIAQKLARNLRAGGASSGMIYSSTGVATGLYTSGSSRPPLDYLLEPARLPVNWTGFTSVRAVAIGKTEWDALSDPQKNALVTWVACGGSLILVDGQLTDVVPSMPGEPASLANLTVGRHFFGRVHALTSAVLQATGLPDVLTAVDASRNEAWSLPANGAPDWGAIEGRGFRLRIPGIEGVPARVYLSILVLFSVIIGPVSFWFLWRRRQRVLLVLTAPLISILFIVLLAGYAMAGEGFGVHGRAVTFTILDEATRHAATRSAVSMYAAGMTPSGGLRFDRDVAVFPIGPTGTGSRERLDLDLSESQRYSGGVLLARAPTNIEQVGFRAARERLTFTRAADVVTVVNGLDATLTHLVYRDGAAAYRLDSPLAPGGKQTLTKGAVDSQQMVPANLAARGKFLALIEQQPVGSYLAVLERSPFWEPGVSDLKERGSFHLVLGFPKGQLGFPQGQLGWPQGQR